MFLFCCSCTGSVFMLVEVCEIFPKTDCGSFAAPIPQHTTKPLPQVQDRSKPMSWAPAARDNHRLPWELQFSTFPSCFLTHQISLWSSGFPSSGSFPPLIQQEEVWLIMPDSTQNLCFLYNSLHIVC